MLVHTSPLISDQAHVRHLVDVQFGGLRDEWRYQRKHGIRHTLQQRWEAKFRSVTRQTHPDRDVPFEAIEGGIGPFLEAVQVREINSATGQVLDYDREPTLKAIAVGGNRLSRGLTLEGLLVSYFVRPSATYDTLMQMGRWFGFRSGYEDLTRIWTTSELAGWFSDLAFAEARLREDIQVYEALGLTPKEVGLRIWQHPSMQVTAPLKRRFASDTVIRQDYSFSLQQTFKFPLRRPTDLSEQARVNHDAVRNLVGQLDSSYGFERQPRGPVWRGVPASLVLDFLGRYRVDAETRSISIPLMQKYIERSIGVGELVSWTIAVRGRENLDSKLGSTDWGIPGGEVPQISRSRIGNSDSLGVITDNVAGDEGTGFTPDQLKEVEVKLAEVKSAGKTLSRNQAARQVRPPEEGLLLFYPISRRSNPKAEDDERGNRRPLYGDPEGRDACDLVGIAISFPQSRQPQPVEAYLQGTVGWRPVE
jgi:Z1 domain